MMPHRLPRKYLPFTSLALLFACQAAFAQAPQPVEPQQKPDTHDAQPAADEPVKTPSALEAAPTSVSPASEKQGAASQEKPEENPATPNHPLPPLQETGGQSASPAPDAQEQTPQDAARQRRRLNPERLVIQAMMRLLVAQGIFPQHVYELYSGGQNPVVDRAHFTTVMIKALGHNTSIVSEFPVYRDVDRKHWAYAPIEVARERMLLGGDKQGYFHPEAPMTRQEAYLAIAGTLAGKRPALTLADEILNPFSDAKDVPEAIRPDIAKLVNASIILPRPQPYNQLGLGRKMRYGELAAILSREIEIKDYRRLLLPVDRSTLPQVPGGVKLLVVPNGAIYKNHLAVGDTIFFSLTEPASANVGGKAVTLPKGTRMDGTLAATHDQFYMIACQGLQTPEGKRYRVHGTLTLEFSVKAAEPFIVPGTPYSVTTEP